MSVSVSFPTLPVRLVRRWVLLYTAGLPADVRDARREEIDADLWEHAREAALMARPTSTLRSQVALRLLLGIAADVAWRIGQIGARQQGETATERRGTMQAVRNSSKVTRGAVLSTVVFAIFTTMLATTRILNGWFADEGLADALRNSAFTASPALTAAGLLVTNRRPVLGGILVVVGAAGMVLALYWAPPLWPLGLAIAVLGIVRARRAMR